MECVFCELKANKAMIVAESELCYSLLDKFPIEEGHLLVIPKAHYADILEAPDEVVSAVFTMAKGLALKLKERMGADGVNIATNIGESAGQFVMHAHVHVIPRHAGKPRSFSRSTELTGKERIRLTTLLQ